MRFTFALLAAFVGLSSADMRMPVARMSENPEHVALIARAVPKVPFIRPPIPGLGTCPEECISVTAPTGALLTCCAIDKENMPEGCVDCCPGCDTPDELCQKDTAYFGCCPDGTFSGSNELCNDGSCPSGSQGNPCLTKGGPCNPDGLTEGGCYCSSPNHDPNDCVDI